MRLVGRIVVVVTALVIALAVAFSVTGYFVYTRASVDRLSHADAIVVLGGEQDGRVDYGVKLAREGYADTVVLSDPYGKISIDGRMMDKYCKGKNLGIRVICFAPHPSTTRGEARFTRDVAEKYDWHHVIVVTWRYHIPRARFIFHQCFAGDVTMHPVPRDYPFGPLKWESTYAYQTVGFLKAAWLGC